MGKPKLLYVLTAARSVKFLEGQLEYMVERGYEVHLIVSKGPELKNIPKSVQCHLLEMEREIAISKDIKAFFQLLKLIRKIKPDVINYGTPKAALLASVAAKITKVPQRIYTMRGLRLETMTGIKKKLLVFIEKLICRSSDGIICVSPSLLKKANELKLVKRSNAYCLGSGSSNGMNITKFQDLSAKASPNLPADIGDQVIGYVGRLAKDKGIDDLVDAFILLKEDFPGAKLLLIGRLEKGHGLRENTVIQIRMQRDIVHLEFQNNIAPFYKKMQLFVLPTYREGFANVAMEAAYSKLPVITTNVTGAKDAVIHDETGLVVEAKNPAALKEAMASLLENPAKAADMGIAGKNRVETEFKRETIWEAIIAMYQY